MRCRMGGYNAIDPYESVGDNVDIQYHQSGEVEHAMTALDNLEELKTFALVVESGSLSAAARILQMTTNAISRRLMRLERNLGVKVLRRSTRAISVTEEGRVLYARARRVVDEIDAAAEEIRGAKDTLRGPISLAIPGGACSPGVFRGLGKLLDANPQLRLQVRIVNSTVDPIVGGYDVVLHVGVPRDSRLIARRLMTSSWVLAAAPSYFSNRAKPKRPQDLVKHRCLRILSGQPQDEWLLVNAEGKTETVSVAGNFESDDSRVLGDAIYAGIGIGVRPKKELAAAIKRGQLVAVLPQYHFESLDVYALMSQGTARLPRIRQFLETLKSALSEVV